MKIEKDELMGRLKMVQDVVPKKSTMPVLQNVLVEDGHVIANDGNMALWVTLEGTEGQRFLLPMAAVSMIGKLPDGEVEIEMDTEKKAVLISAQKVSYDVAQPEEADVFPMPRALTKEGDNLTLPGESFVTAVRHVLYAVDDSSANRVMGAMCLQSTGEALNVVGIDGKRIAWEQLDVSLAPFELLIPKQTMTKLKGMNIGEKLMLRYDKMGAVFSSDDFSLTTRLIDGTFFKYGTMFDEIKTRISINRGDFLASLERAALCTQGEPIAMELSERSIRISCQSARGDFEEKISLGSMAPMSVIPLTIGFDARLLIETLRTVDDETLYMSLTNAKSPMILMTTNEKLKMLTLPVVLRGGR